MTGNSDPRVSIPAGFPTGIPVVSRGLPGLVPSLTLMFQARYALFPDPLLVLQSHVVLQDIF